MNMNCTLYKIFKRSVLRVLKKLNIIRIKCIIGRKSMRMQFCELTKDLCHQNPRFICFILKEATFCLNGRVNRQNCRYWITEAHPQHSQTANVWAGIVQDSIIGSFSFDEFTHPYKHFPNVPNERLWFQQDGAPSHFRFVKFKQMFSRPYTTWSFSRELLKSKRLYRSTIFRLKVRIIYNIHKGSTVFNKNVVIAASNAKRHW